MSYDSNNNNLFSDSYQISSALHEMSYQQKVSTLQIEIAKATDRETRQRLQALLDETIEKHNKGRTGMFIIAVIMLILVLGVAGFIFFSYLPGTNNNNANQNNIENPVSSSTSSTNNTSLSQSSNNSMIQQSQAQQSQSQDTSNHQQAENIRDNMVRIQGLNRDVLNSIPDSEILSASVGNMTNADIAQTARNLLAKYPNLKNQKDQTDTTTPKADNGTITKPVFRQWVANVWNQKSSGNEADVLNNPHLNLAVSKDKDGYAIARISIVQSDTIDLYRINSAGQLEESNFFMNRGQTEGWTVVSTTPPTEITAQAQTDHTEPNYGNY